MRLRHLSLPALLAVGCLFSSAPAMAQDRAAPTAVALDAPMTMDRLIPQLAAGRVVFVGETHDRYDHHLNQLEIIRRLHQLEPALAIGVEYFQQRYQPQLDDYVAGKITEAEFLRDTHYFREWGYDYRLYAPIFRYAREQRIPVRALNIPNTLASAVTKVGLAGLPAEQRAELPKDIEPADDAYKARLRGAFDQHQATRPGAFDHFVEAQTVWDESMAAAASEYLNANPGRRMVVLAGSGHVAFGSGIPKRLERRSHAAYKIVLSSGEEIEPHIADFILLSEKQELPPAGILGVTLKDVEGECRVGAVTPGGAAAKAGIKAGDVLAALDAQPVKTSEDVRLALWDKQPGQRVRLQVRRKRRTREIELELAPSGRPGIPIP